MMRDIVWNVNTQEINLSPKSNASFPRHEIGLSSVDIRTAMYVQLGKTINLEALPIKRKTVQCYPNAPYISIGTFKHYNNWVGQ